MNALNFLNKNLRAVSFLNLIEVTFDKTDKSIVVNPGHRAKKLRPMELTFDK